MKILRVDMRNLSVKLEDLPVNWTAIGGRALTARILRKEVHPTIDPLSAEAKIILACGPLAGTRAPSCGRLSIGAKSPLTLGIKETNAGGPIAQKLDRLGIRAIVIENTPTSDQFYILKITNNGIEILPGQEWAGLKNYSLAEGLFQRFGTTSSIISIGIAGERQWKSATIALTDREGKSSRHAARGGLGAVMGAKGIKAIVIDDSDCDKPEIHDPKAFKQTINNWAELTKKDIALTYLQKFGTPGMISTMQYLNCMPTNNYQQSSLQNIEQLTGEEINRINRLRGGSMSACMPGCLVNCSITYRDKKRKFKTSNLQYQTIAMMGSNLGITDPDVIAEFDYLCDNLGIDSIELGSTLGVAAGLNLMKLGDPKSVLRLFEHIDYGTELGSLLANGVEGFCRRMEIDRVPSYKGQAIPANDPRAIKTAGVSYATSPMGADHTCDLSGHTHKISKDHLSDSLAGQIQSAIIDAFGFCLLAVPTDNSAVLEYLKNLVNARYNLNLTETGLVDLGIDLLRDELEFNKTSGFYTQHMDDPSFIREESIGRQKKVFDIESSKIKNFWSSLESKADNKHPETFSA